MELFRGAALVAATITTGLSAGLFYTFACSVMIGLGATSDRTFVEAMQQINVKIINGWFFLGFGGALLFIVLAGVLQLSAERRSALPWIVAALALYIATLAITFAANTPLNDALVAAGPIDRIGDLAAVREQFEASWVRWNLARVVTSTAAFGCITWALVQFARS
jgi:uncharacterized membrane protein